jgi:murein DD-endopeptidase MepM/ murein hydrolase activator NlpD
MIRWLALFIFLFIIVAIGMALPSSPLIPVVGADYDDWNADSFWQYPWGSSITHKGIDIFADYGTSVIASTSGIVSYSGSLSKGGIVVTIIGPKWRFYYYAHLRDKTVKSLSWVNRGDIIGYVGTSGNAIGKAPHLHYSIASPLPCFSRWDNSIQGWKKMFYYDPNEELR